VESEKESEGTVGDPKALNIYQRLLEVRREVHNIDKNGKHGSGFRFVSHDDVTRALGGLYVKWGIDREVSVVDAKRDANIIGMRVQVSWVNVDNPSDRKTIEVYSEGVDIIKRDGQMNTDGLAAGKGLSYAVKSAELKNFCLVGDNTPDNERSNAREESTPVEPPSQEEYDKLCEAYKSCSDKNTLTSLRERLTPLVNQKKLTTEQMATLSKLDSAARERSK
jgi:hypothetical protein